MGDMADELNAFKAYKRGQKYKRLSEADTTGWTKHTAYHFSRAFNGTRAQWWPSTAKLLYEGKVYCGARDVGRKISELITEEQKP